MSSSPVLPMELNKGVFPSLDLVVDVKGPWLDVLNHLENKNTGVPQLDPPIPQALRQGESIEVNMRSAGEYFGAILRLGPPMFKDPRLHRLRNDNTVSIVYEVRLDFKLAQGSDLHEETLIFMAMSKPKKRKGIKSPLKLFNRYRGEPLPADTKLVNPSLSLPFHPAEVYTLMEGYRMRNLMRWRSLIPNCYFTSFGERILVAWLIGTPKQTVPLTFSYSVQARALNLKDLDASGVSLREPFSQVLLQPSKLNHLGPKSLPLNPTSSDALKPFVDEQPLFHDGLDQEPCKSVQPAYPSQESMSNNESVCKSCSRSVESGVSTSLLSSHSVFANSGRQYCLGLSIVSSPTPSESSYGTTSSSESSWKRRKTNDDFSLDYLYSHSNLSTNVVPLGCEDTDRCGSPMSMCICDSYSSSPTFVPSTSLGAM
eukprot:gb/GEZN01008675.1/.p1 GENE.gb/GEZN01008675.1/~~gb/GEZN01008675.1/.p1  ORF type:complete len:436 (+),score=34.90 gb/GEZN01008675.1/:28-1308(+)